MLLIYIHQATDRVKYTLNLIFGSVLGIEYDVTTDKEAFSKYPGARLSYSHEPVSNELHISSNGLLHDTGINTSALTLLSREENPEFPKDIFAFSFFLATRYEEYLPFTPDHHGRFTAKHSFSFKNNILGKPVINIWAGKLRDKIKASYPSLIFPEKQYSYTPTIDIDNAYAYLGKNPVRTLGGYAKAFTKGDKEDIAKRKNVLAGKEKDPYDTYELQFELHKKYGLKPVYFFLLGDWAPNDKNLPHTSPLMQELIKKVSSKAETGIHPSYASNENTGKVVIELERLNKLIPPPAPSSGGQTAISRQHFLKLRFPDTYRNLIAAGITDDYTMGYADEVGFRAGICVPYKWYDLKKEEETGLTLHPFAVMDGTLNSYLKQSPAQALEKVKKLVQEVKQVNGEFISIWHNETLSDWKDWKGWKELYEQILRVAV